MNDKREIRIEVKTIRNSGKASVELQKTRASKGDIASRYYGLDHFDVVAVNVGRKTGDWAAFRYAFVRDLEPHKNHGGKIAVMHSVDSDKWLDKLHDVFDSF